MFLNGLRKTAAYIGISVNGVYALKKDPDFPYKMVGNRFTAHSEAIDQYYGVKPGRRDEA